MSNHVEHRKDRADRKLKGVCIECVQPVCPESKVRCTRHLLKNQERVERHNRNRMPRAFVEIVPSQLSRPVTPSARCEKHNARSHAYMQRRRALKTISKAA